VVRAGSKSKQRSRQAIAVIECHAMEITGRIGWRRSGLVVLLLDCRSKSVPGTHQDTGNLENGEYDVGRLA
jgi:hypothetical protein